MKKQKVEVEKYTLVHQDICTILGLSAGQKITDISATHSTSTNWSVEVTVQTTHVTELPVPTHHNSK